jgi:predicted NACHT family NTPase
MAERSLRATSEGIEKAETALTDRAWRREDLQEKIGVSRQPIVKFFSGKPIDRKIFSQICQELGLNWQGICDKGNLSSTEPLSSNLVVSEQSEESEVPPAPEIYSLIQFSREQIHSHIAETCKIPLDLDSGYMPTLENIRSHTRLMLLGEQGSGKTTYLKYVATQCILGVLLNNYVPVILDLKDFSEDSSNKSLLEFISQQFFSDDIVPTQGCSLHRFVSKSIHELITHGNALILLDGLDQVKDDKIFQTLKQISELAQHFLFVKICFTCQDSVWKRIQKKYRFKATDYISENFKEILGKNYINGLTQRIRDQIKTCIQDRCGTMRILDMTKPIGLTDIYTNVNVLEQITGRRRKDIAELLQEANIDDFDRFGLGMITQKGVPGLEVVNKHSRLMILGKPGAGKTTFLKYVAIQCNNNQFLSNRVPIFVTLKDFAEAEGKTSIVKYISQQLFQSGVAYSQVSALLKYGRILILLDGLDEVREEDARRVIKQIQDFSENFAFSEQFKKDSITHSAQIKDYYTDASYKWLSRTFPEKFYVNYIVITCRIAAREYTFENFTEVEVADFNDEQIRTFTTNWFKDKAVKVYDFMDRINKNSRIKQLATNPLLLTLLCLAFEESGDFPVNRSELYKEGLDALLKKWDAKRGIQRAHFYKKLSVQRKEELLSNVALITFDKKDYFFKKKDVEKYITDYICHLPNANTDPEELLLDGEEVLRLIVAQHGLLLERAVGIFSFSHLTFHEYFVARELIFGQPLLHESIQKLASHTTDRRWREVLLLAVEMLPSADSLLELMKQKIDSLIFSSRKLQAFLMLIHKKSLLIHSSYKKATIRASYISGMANDGTDGTEFDYRLALSLVQGKEIEKGRNLFSLVDPLKFDYEIEKILNLANRLNSCNIEPSQNSFKPNAEIFLNTLSKLELSCFSDEISSSLKKLKQKVPTLEKAKAFEEWWVNNGFDWMMEWEILMNKCFIKNMYVYSFSSKHKRLLKQYYDSNMLLAECLNSDCYINSSTRQFIEESLLLPIIEIKKLRMEKSDHKDLTAS